MKFLILSIPIFFFSCLNKKNEAPEIFSGGFQTIQKIDTTRIYKPNTDTTDYLHYRPLDIDLWYPANVSSNDKTLFFRDILGLLESRANYYTASVAGNGITQQIAHFFCENLRCSDSTKVLNFVTQSFKNARPVEGKFPLVIYLSAFNGMSYENFILFEELAKKGYVVASVSSIGRFPGDMTMKNEDLMEQVYDAIATLNDLKGNPAIDFTKIGIIGYSWGGLSASILASKISGVKCLISLDGSEFHHYANEKEDNANFEIIRNSPDFKNLRLSVPYLRLESSPLTPKETQDSIYNFKEKLFSDVHIYKINSSQHEDFGCMPQLVKESGKCNPNPHYKTVLKLTLSFIEEYLKNGQSFANDIDKEMGNKTIRKN